MNILECCSIFYNTLISNCYGKKKIVREKENIIPQQTKIEIPVIKRNQQLNEPKIFTFEKTFEKPVLNNYIVVNQFEDEDDYDIV